MLKKNPPISFKYKKMKGLVYGFSKFRLIYTKFNLHILILKGDHQVGGDLIISEMKTTPVEQKPPYISF